MDTAPNINCTSCKKSIATDYARCTSCGNDFHPGCYKPHKIVGPSGEKSSCTGRMQAVKRAGPAPALPTASPVTESATQATQAAGTASSPEPTLSVVLAAVQACSDAIASFKATQTKHNVESEGQLGNLRKDLSGRLDRLSADLRSVADRVREVEASVDTLKNDVKAVSSKHDALSASLSSRLSAVEEQQRTFAEVVAAVKEPTSAMTGNLTNLTSRIARLEGLRRDAELIVSGLPEQPNEDLRELLRKAAAVVGNPINPAEIIRVTRMKGTADPARPRLIHVVLSSRNARDALLAGKRKKGKIMAVELDPSLPSRPVYVNEYLPRDTLILLRSVRLEARSRGYRYIWHRAGVIYVKKDSNSQAIAIHDLQEIATKLE